MWFLIRWQNSWIYFCLNAPSSSLIKFFKCSSPHFAVSSNCFFQDHFLNVWQDNENISTTILISGVQVYLSDNENVGSDNHLGLRISQSESILTDMTHVISPMSHHSFHAKSPISAGINQHVTVRVKKNSHLFTHQSAFIMDQHVVLSHIVFL